MYRIPASLTKCLAVAGLMAASLSCTKEDGTTTPGKVADTSSLGWKGSDNTDSIPQGVDFGTNLFSNQTLPTSVDLDQYLPPVGDQGQFGTCVAWAVGYGCKTAIEAIKFGRSKADLSSTANQLSPKDLFIAIDDNVKGASDCNGTNFTPALDVIQGRGVATMQAAPYTGLGNCAKSNLDPAWATSAASHKISRYRKIGEGNNPTETIKAIKTELANKNPVILGAKLADNFMSWGNADAVYTSHSGFNNTGQHAYHAMLIVGYDDAKPPRGAFKVLNSWGNNWGNAGYVWIDQQFLANGFSFGGNLFTATNADQTPDNTPTPPTPSGADLRMWVKTDSVMNGVFRKIEFDLFNEGNTPVPSSTGGDYAYIYYNAYDADDYDVIFYDYTTDQVSPSQGFVCQNGSATEYPGCVVNATLPARSSLAQGLGFSYLWRTYNMPPVTGFYYLVMISDIIDQFQEADENNNLFYTTPADPLLFIDGEQMRRDGSATLAKTYNFRNPMSVEARNTKAARQFQTAVNKKHLNAYSPEEIIGFLKMEAKKGNLQRKLREYKSKQINSAVGFAKQ